MDATAAAAVAAAEHRQNSINGNSASNSNSENLPPRTVKVLYKYDDEKSPLPYLVNVELPAGRDAPCLVDVQPELPRRGVYKFFTIRFDEDLSQDVKVELVDPMAPIGRDAKGNFSLFLLAIADSEPTQMGRAGTLPRTSSRQQQRAAPLEYHHRPTEICRRRSLLDITDSSLDATGLEQLVALHYQQQQQQQQQQAAGTVDRRREPPRASTASSFSTVLSRRAGEQMADICTSASENNANHRGNGTSSWRHGAPLAMGDDSMLSATTYEPFTTMNGGESGLTPDKSGAARRRRRKERFRRQAYEPSTASSLSSSSAMPHLVLVDIDLRTNSNLGMRIGTHNGGVYVVALNPNGAVAQTGKVSPHDQIVMVNHHSFENLDVEKAVELILAASRKKGKMQMFVVKQTGADTTGPSGEGGGDETTFASGWGMNGDETHPIDVSTWVQYAIQQHREMGRINEEVSTSSSGASGMTLDDGTLDVDMQTDDDGLRRRDGGVDQDEEDQDEAEANALYELRRNGCPPPPAPSSIQQQLHSRVLMQQQQQQQQHKFPLRHLQQQQQQQQQQMALRAGGTALAGNALQMTIANQAKPPINANAVATDSVVLRPLAVAMARSDSGLVVKNRKWLKLPVPMSFIGRDLVNWMKQVPELEGSHKKARQLAERLLQADLIRHVVQKHTFTEKCYYQFNDSVLTEARSNSSTGGAAVANAADTTAGAGTTTSSGGGGGNGVTEITTLPNGPSASPTALSQQQRPQILAPPAWNHSPITAATTANTRHRVRCESPMTNVYESMVDDETGTGPGGKMLNGAAAAAHARQQPTRSAAVLPPPPPPAPSASGTSWNNYYPQQQPRRAHPPPIVAPRPTPAGSSLYGGITTASTSVVLLPQPNPSPVYTTDCDQSELQMKAAPEEEGEEDEEDTGDITDETTDERRAIVTAVVTNVNRRR